MPAEEQSPMQCPGPTIKIWRYFRLDKFELLLRHAALYFSSVDRLVADDQYEGSSDLSELEERKKYSDAVKASCESFNRYPAPLHTMVNCWYSGEDESKAMWTLYANGGVCIESSLQDLCSECSIGRDKVFHWSKEKGRMNCEGTIEDVFVDEIYYYRPNEQSDQRTDPHDWRNKYTRKPIWFKHESEVRALFRYQGTDMFSGAIPERPAEAPVSNIHRTTDERILASNRGYAEYFKRLQESRRFTGVYLPVNLKKLISRIVLSPNTPHRMKHEVETLTRHWGFSFQVDFSAVDTPARF
jgi:hypothetical protein